MVDELNEEDINSIIAYLAKSKIIKVAYPTLMNILKVKEEHIDLIKRSNLNYDELITIDINQDLEQSQAFFVAVLKIAKEIDLNNVSIEAILTNQNIKLNISKNPLEICTVCLQRCKFRFWCNHRSGVLVTESSPPIGRNNMVIISTSHPKHVIR